VGTEGQCLSILWNDGLKFKLSEINVDTFHFISSENSGCGEHNEAHKKRDCLA
jgi:hypothetical protein